MNHVVFDILEFFPKLAIHNARRFIFVTPPVLENNKYALSQIDT